MKFSAILVLCAAVIVTAQATTVMDVITSNSELSIFAALLDLAGLDTTLAGTGPFTVFAPTNTALKAFPSYKGAYLKENPDMLAALLKYHIASGDFPVSGLTENEKILTLQGSHLFAEQMANTTTMTLTDATCEKNVMFQGAQLSASNGLVSVIDAVLVPPAVFCPDEVFWVEQRGNGRIGYSGYDCRARGTDIVSANQEKPVGLAVDSPTKQVFWSNDQNAKPFDSWLTKANFDGSDVHQFLGNLYDPQGMDTDSSAQKLYFVEHQGNMLHRCNYDGSEVETLLETGANWFPADVSLDVEEELIFVTIQSVPTVLEGKLAVLFFNGTGYRELKTGLIQNFGVCVDDYHKHVYYVESGHGGSIGCYAYGSTPCHLDQNGNFLSDLQYPYMCDVDNVFAPYGGPSQLIWSASNVPGSIYAINTDGTNQRTLVDNLNAPMGVKVGCVNYDA